MLFFDIEGDGLLSSVKNIWCIHISDGKGFKQTYTKDGKFNYPTIEEGVKLLAESEDTLVAHNGLGYDIPAIQKVCNVEIKTNCFDTFTISCLLNPARADGHSQAAWGERLGCLKGNHSDFTQLTEEMIAYCEQDVQVLIKIYEALQEEIKQKKWPKISIDLELKVAAITGKQMLNGWKFDEAGAEHLLNLIQDSIQECDRDLQTKVKMKCFPGNVVNAPFKKNGQLIKRLEDFQEVSGPFTFVKFDYPNLASRQQLAELLRKEGWTPTAFTEKSQQAYEKAIAEGATRQEAETLLTPIVNGEVLETLTGNVGSVLSTRFNYIKRRGLIEGCYNDAKERGDGRVTAGVISNGARSGRATHQLVNLS